MAEVRLEAVRKVYPGGRGRDVEAVREFTLAIADGEFVVLVGPSGCGKSTTLRMVAGLEEVTSGTIRIGERVVNDVHPKDRDIAMVFQNYALYPHMSVYKNMAFALTLRRTPKAEIERRVREAARILGIEELLERKPRQLSGGQRQRVAVGRAIVREPKAFLFDEPLSNLDAKLRVTTRAELKALHQRLRTTTIYVTHDQEEAMTLGDRIVVMSNGLIQQAGAPLEVYGRPANRFVAAFVGTPPMNFLEGSLVREGGVWFVGAGGGVRLRLTPGQADRLSGFVGKPVVLGLRPQTLRDLRETAAAGGGTAGADGSSMMLEVRVVEPLGDTMDVYASTARGETMVARVPARMGMPVGRAAAFGVEMEGAQFFEPGEFGRNLMVG